MWCMARKLKVYKNSEGTPAVKCPRCDELITPEHFVLMDGFECPECNQAIEQDQLGSYLVAMRDYEDDIYD